MLKKIMLGVGDNKAVKIYDADDKGQFKVGDKIKCKSWRQLRSLAFTLSSKGYGVAVNGFADMSDDILTIMALPIEGE